MFLGVEVLVDSQMFLGFSFSWRGRIDSVGLHVGFRLQIFFNSTD